MKEGVIRKEVQTLLAPDRMREMKAIPIEMKDDAVVVAFADPMNYIVVENVKVRSETRSPPSACIPGPGEDILDHLDRVGYGEDQVVLENVRRSISTVTINEINGILHHEAP